MKPSSLAAAIDRLIDAQQPSFVWGQPGIGKSSIVAQVAARRSLPVCDVRAVLLDPVDLRGLPHINGDNRAHWCPPEFLPRDGARILPAQHFDKYSRSMRTYQATFTRAVSDFLPKYPDYVEDAKRRLNGMFDPADYPTARNIESRYSFETSIDPIPDAPDFRVSLQAEEVNTIRQEIATRNQVAVESAMRDLWDRLYAAVSSVVERLSKPDAIFRDSLIGNLRELVKALPTLNLTNDPNLDAMTRTIEAKLLTASPDTLRDVKSLRSKTAQDAQAILETMKAYTGN